MLGSTCSLKDYGWESRKYEVSQTYLLGVEYADRSTCITASEMERVFNLTIVYFAISGSVSVYFFRRRAKDAIISFF